ncbi:MAG: porin family protein [Methylobacteriaceae bacterium]|nr:porin family protein [Methylobacteriaceae bacterium]
MSRRVVLASLSILAFAAAAEAADLPRRSGAPAPAPMSAPAFSWTGAYVGVNGGYAWGRHTKGGRALYARPDGGLIGATAGYNQQSGSIVAGVEGDVAATAVKSSGVAPGPVTGASRLTSLATARARVGVALDRALIYGTGGYAGGNLKNTLFDAPRGLGYRQEKWLNGYAVGAGVEYAVTNNITAKGEYIYADLGKKTYFAAPNALPTGLSVSTVRAGVNYKF